MTAPHKATEQQWGIVRRRAKNDFPDSTDSVLLELAHRVAAMESQHNLVVDNITDLQGCVNQLEAAATPSPAPAGDPVAAPSGLVERVLRQLPSGTDPVFARQAILEVAEWADQEDLYRTMRRLREEAVGPTAQPTPPPAPAGGLVESVIEEICHITGNRPADYVARGIIRAVAAWLETQQEAPAGSASRMRRAVAMLRQEADR